MSLARHWRDAVSARRHAGRGWPRISGSGQTERKESPGLYTSAAGRRGCGPGLRGCGGYGAAGLCTNLGARRGSSSHRHRGDPAAAVPARVPSLRSPPDRFGGSHLRPSPQERRARPARAAAHAPGTVHSVHAGGLLRGPRLAQRLPWRVQLLRVRLCHLARDELELGGGGCSSSASSSSSSSRARLSRSAEAGESEQQL